MVDALARSRGLSSALATLGFADVISETDIRCPSRTTRVDALAAMARARFSNFKLKLGGDLDADVRRVERLAASRMLLHSRREPASTGRCRECVLGGATPACD
jgi:hypothetical protein